MLPRTREAGGTHRIQVIAWPRVLLTGLRHSHPAHRYSRGISSWRRGHLSALRHSHPAHRYSRGIPSWRRGHLSALRHGHLAHRCSRGIIPWRDCLSLLYGSPNSDKRSVLIFDWQGNPLQKIDLPFNVQSVEVDFDNRTLITSDYETEELYFHKY